MVGMVKKSVGKMAWKTAPAPAPTPVPAKKRGWGPVPKAPPMPAPEPQAAPPAAPAPTNYWDWLPDELQDEVLSHNVLRGLCGMPDWDDGRGPRVRYCVPTYVREGYTEAVRYNKQGSDKSQALPMPGIYGSRKDQMVAVPPPEFWRSIRQEVERMGMGRPVPKRTRADYGSDYSAGSASPRPLDPTESPVILKDHAMLAFDGMDGAWSEDDYNRWKTGADEDWPVDELDFHQRRREMSLRYEQCYPLIYASPPCVKRYPHKGWFDEGDHTPMASFRLQTDPATLHLFWLTTNSDHHLSGCDHWHSELQVQAALDAETLRRYGAHGPWNKGPPDGEGSMDLWLKRYYNDIEEALDPVDRTKTENDVDEEPAWCAPFRIMEAEVDAEAKAEAEAEAQRRADDAYWSEQALGVADVHVHAVRRAGAGRGGHALDDRGARMLGDDSRSRPKALFG